MANYIRTFPTTSGGDPEVLPWATDGVTLEPSPGQESNGWQPQAIAGPPDYRLENYARFQQSVINTRGRQTALFLEYARAEITLAGFAAGLNNRRITVNGHNFDQTDATDLNTTRDAFVAAINSDPLVSIWVYAESTTGGKLRLTDRTPGNVYTVSPSLAVSVLAGAGTITVSSPATTPIVREDDTGMAADLVIGSSQADHDGNAAHDNRIIWHKSRASFRAGSFSTDVADLANTGNYSVAMGSEAKASGDNSHAYGSGATATGDASIAAGNLVTASALNATAVGKDSTASAVAATAIGKSATASGLTSLAMQGATASASNAIGAGSSAAASGADSLALGTGATASAANAIALGNATASNAKSIAIGYQVTASTAEGAMATGSGAAGAIVASGQGARAHGKSTAGELKATGDGASASGYVGGGKVTATGNGSLAHGYANTGAVYTVASGVNSIAIGNGVQASGDYSGALGFCAYSPNRGEHSLAASVFTTGAFSTPSIGSAQKGETHAILRTTDATADQILTPGAGAVTFTPATDSVYLLEVNVVAKKEGSDDYFASWSFKGTMAPVAGTMTLKNVCCVQNGGGVATWVNIAVNAAITHFYDGGAGGAAYVLKANSVGGALILKATGAAGENVRWSASIDYVCVGGVA